MYSFKFIKKVLTQKIFGNYIGGKIGQQTEQRSIELI